GSAGVADERDRFGNDAGGIQISLHGRERRIFSAGNSAAPGPAGLRRSLRNAGVGPANSGVAFGDIGGWESAGAEGLCARNEKAETVRIRFAPAARRSRV